VVYKSYAPLQDAKHNYDLLKTVCGLLNADGGVVFIGVTEDKHTGRKETHGYTITEKEKELVRTHIYDLVDLCISPNIAHDMLRIMYVPIRNKDS